MLEHSLLAIKAAYQLLLKTFEIEKLRSHISYFNSHQNNSSYFIKSESAIHCKLISGNQQVQDAEEKLNQLDVFVKSIKSPTVKEGQERLRICLHSFNTKQEIDLLLNSF
jgi:8-amino-7-oxononanoate synthase